MPLTEEQLELFGERLVPVFQRLEQFVIQDIARRLRKTARWTETAELQAEHLRGLGYSPSRIQTEVLRTLNASLEYQAEVAQNTLEYKKALADEIKAAREELRKTAPKLAAEVGAEAFRSDLSLWEQAGKPLKKPTGMGRLLSSMAKGAKGELLNLTKSTGFVDASGRITPAKRAYTAALNDALAKTVSGASGHQQAIQDAVRSLTKSGLRSVDYKSGVTRQVDSACRNATLTASAQLTGEITQRNIEETGVEYVEVSKHAGARPSHAEWQGKVFKYKDFVRICKYGQTKDPDAIYSYHCRHRHYPFWPGISTPNRWEEDPEPKEYHGKTYTYYDATQKQRRMEREIRYLKRDACAQSVLEDSGSFDKTAYLIKQKEAEYKRFSEQMKIRPKLDRVRVVGYDKDIS